MSVLRTKTRLSYALVLFSLLFGMHSWGPVAARDTSFRSLNAKRLEVAKRWELSARNGDALSSADTSAPSRVKITFSNPKASQFYVNGATIPEVNFDVGPSWSGLIPISDAANETRKLFFWLFPPGPEESLDDLIFWTNAIPTPNEWSWTNFSRVLYVEQPIGTGFPKERQLRRM